MKNLWNLFTQRFNISLLETEMKEIVETVKQAIDPNNCTSCQDRRGVACPWEKGSNMCKVVLNNRRLHERN